MPAAWRVLSQADEACASQWLGNAVAGPRAVSRRDAGLERGAPVRAPPQPPWPRALVVAGGGGRPVESNSGVRWEPVLIASLGSSLSPLDAAQRLRPIQTWLSHRPVAAALDCDRVKAERSPRRIHCGGVEGRWSVDVHAQEDRLVGTKSHARVTDVARPSESSYRRNISIM